MSVEPADLFIARLAAAQRAAMIERIRKEKAAGKPARNKACPCGSGRKHKKCCLRKDR